ncbi:MAG: choice-of-anchor B family protein [Crocinitomicaceae bacterium]
MKFLTFVFCFFLFQFSAQEIKNVTLLDQWFSDTLLTNTSQVRYSGCWAFEQAGREYGIIGSTEGAHFFELTETDKFKFIDFVSGSFVSSQAINREYKHFKNYVYAVCDDGPSSLQIIDVSYLPDSVHLVADLRNNLFGKTHNLFVDSLNELLFMCQVTPVINNIESSMIPLRVYSLSDPTNPALLWQSPEEIQDVHDIYVRDNLAILNCGYDGIRVYDFSNPTNPIYLSNLQVYQQQGYNHQGWLCPDGETYVFADETAGTMVKKAKLKSDFTIDIESYFGRPNSPYNKTAHNIQCTNEFAFIAYYNDGLRIYDLRLNPPREVAVYDTYIDNELTNSFSMWGAWGIHALLPSERILVSDRNTGFYMFDFDRDFFLNQASDEVIVYPNPIRENQQLTIRMPYDKGNEFKYELYDPNGKKIKENSILNQSFAEVNPPEVSGIYFLKVKYMDSFSNEVSVIKKFVVE